MPVTARARNFERRIMAVERKIVVGIEDIEAVRLECKNKSCRKQLVFPADSSVEIPHNCTCGQSWLPVAVVKTKEADSPLFNFLNLMPDVRRLATTPGVGFKILLEFDDPK
jgi:hypothetical protein